MIDMDVYDETGVLDEIYLETVRHVLEKAAEYEGVNGTEVSVTFVDDEKIRTLNRTYRDTDSATDVLSFALQEDGEGEIRIADDDVPQTLGDIVISVPKAKEQAESYHHTLMREIGFLAVHGFLHLCGYDHGSKEEEQKMFTRQKDILESYGLKR